MHKKTLRWVFGALCLGLSLSGAAVAPAEPPGPTTTPLPVEIASGDKGVRYIGRFDTSDPAGPRCSWPASSVVLRFAGSALNVRLQDTGNDDRYDILVDGQPAGPLKLTAGSHLYSVFTAPTAGEHTVALVKRTESFCGITRFAGFQLAAGGKLLSPPSPSAHRIEVVGDSISCGYGNEGKSEKEHFSPDTEDAYQTYGAFAARELGAEYVCVAWSGRKMWPNNTMDEVYGRALATDTSSKWDFSRWTPEVVVITLGTNDFGKEAPEQAGWVKGYRAFMARVRTNYPKAAFYCATSPMMWGKSREVVHGYLEQIVQEEHAAGHPEVRLLEFPQQDAAKDGLGSDWHPNVKTHQKMAGILSAALQKDMGWKPISR